MLYLDIIHFYSTKQNDRTYTISGRKYGNSEIYETGVRGCNVVKIIRKLNNKYNSL
jgi:hypothetical protein